MRTRTRWVKPFIGKGYWETTEVPECTWFSDWLESRSQEKPKKDGPVVTWLYRIFVWGFLAFFLFFIVAGCVAYILS